LGGAEDFVVSEVGSDGPDADSLPESATLYLYGLPGPAVELVSPSGNLLGLEVTSTLETTLTVDSEFSREDYLRFYSAGDLYVNYDLSADSITVFADANWDGSGDLYSREPPVLTLTAHNHTLGGAGDFELYGDEIWYYSYSEEDYTFVSELVVPLNSSLGNLEIVSTANNITVAEAVSRTGGHSIDLNAGDTIYIYDTLSTDTGDINLTADDYVIDGLTIISDTGDITLANRSDGRPIALGYTTPGDDLEIDDEEISLILTAGLITIGSRTAGTMTVETADFDTQNIALISGSEDTINVVGALSTTTGNINLTVDAYDADINVVSGGSIYSESGNITLEALAGNSAHINVNGPIYTTTATAGKGNITLTAMTSNDGGGTYSIIDVNSPITTVAGNISLTASNIVNINIVSSYYYSEDYNYAYIYTHYPVSSESGDIAIEAANTVNTIVTGSSPLDYYYDDSYNYAEVYIDDDIYTTGDINISAANNLTKNVSADSIEEEYDDNSDNYAYVYVYDTLTTTPNGVASTGEINLSATNDIATTVTVNDSIGDYEDDSYNYAQVYVSGNTLYTDTGDVSLTAANTISRDITANSIGGIGGYDYSYEYDYDNDGEADYYYHNWYD
ncbi:MAG: hypothetical protein AAB267_02190, partial [Candidatus Desantisbacteria bacterium]